MTDMNKDTRPQDSNRAGPIGRILRFGMAGFVTAIVAPYYLTTSLPSNLKIAAAIGGLLILTSSSKGRQATNGQRRLPAAKPE